MGFLTVGGAIMLQNRNFLLRWYVRFPACLARIERGHEHRPGGYRGLATKATKIAFGGADTGKPSALEMGSGRKANDGWQRAAYQNDRMRFRVRWARFS